MMFAQWQDFISGRWMSEIDVRYIRKITNLTMVMMLFFSTFSKTSKLWAKCGVLRQEHAQNGVLK